MCLRILLYTGDGVDLLISDLNLVSIQGFLPFMAHFDCGLTRGHCDAVVKQVRKVVLDSTEYLVQEN